MSHFQKMPAAEPEWYHEFVDLKHRPSKDDLLALFRVSPSAGFSMKDAAGRVASESSVGTWTTLTTLTRRVRSLMAKAYRFSGEYVTISYPSGLFEPGNMPQILSSIAGNVFGMKAVSSLKLVDVRWPPSLVSSFPGPQFGRDGIRRFMKVKKRPLTASVPKPKLGLTYEEHARYGYEAWLGGLDLLKDDENLTNQGFNSFERRARLCFRYRDKAEKETGERKSYLINITADTSEMERRAKLVHSLGGEYVMVDICTTGWGALETVRSFCKDLGLAIHAHRAFHATFTRSRRHGMSMAVLAETARLIGVDQLHIGTVIGKLVGSKSEVLGLQDKIVSRISRRGEFSFSQDWGGLRPVFPVSSGGLHVGIVGALMSLLGTDIVIQVGGGIWGHPSGGRSGAKALRDAIDAFTQGVDLESYATRSRELREALEKWGTRSYR